MENLETVKMKNKVLIIDDEEDILSSCKNVLEDEDYDVDIAKDYDEALKIFESKKIDLVFLDVWLPNTDGLDILSNIKEKYPKTTVIMMSGHAGVETAVRATKLGAYDFLEKPISISKLLSSCEEVLNKKENNKNEENSNYLNEHENHNKSKLKYRIPQRTIAKSVVVSGFALMEGRKTALTLVPAEVNTGIVFIDINTNTHIKLSHENILSKDKSGAVNSTALINGNRYIKTTEHFLAALKEAGFIEQEDYIEPIVIDRELTYGKVDDNETYIILSPYDGLEVNLRIDFSGSIGVQQYDYKFESFEQFSEDIGKARSFNTLDNIDYAQKMGMAGSGMIGSHIILCEGKVINTKLHFDNEFVRHKILDIIGDLYILARPIKAKIIANKSSHSFNHSVVHDIANKYL